MDEYTNTNYIPGWMSPRECRLLNTLFAKYNYPGAIGIEVGSCFGRSSSEISKSIPQGQLFCIDKWNGMVIDMNRYKIIRPWYPKHGDTIVLETFLNYTKDFKNIQHIVADSPESESLRNWSGLVDFVFLDAGHVNPSDREYIDFWLPKIKPGGIFAGHDYYPNSKYSRHPDVTENVEYLEARLRQKVKSTVGTIWHFDL